MARSPFSVFTRKSRDRKTKKAVVRYCARFFDEDGNIVKTKTLEATTPTKAALEAKLLLDKGAIASADPLALDFLADFWCADSDYAREKKRTGRPLSIGYIENNAAMIARHLSVPLRGVRLRQLTSSRMEKIIQALGEAGMKPRSQNYLIQAVRVPVSRWARHNRAPDPLEFLARSAEAPKVRGTLSVEEIGKIIALESASPRAKAAVLLGALCGLRLGEVRGLQWEDVDREAGLLHVVHNFVDKREGVKGPKAGSRRDVPLPAAVITALDLCKAVAPHESGFVIWNEKTPASPVWKHTLERGFKAILEEIGIDEEKRKARNLVFHGLRHSYVSISRATGLPDFVVQRLAGHKSMAMTERYSHADNVVDFAAARLKIDEAMKPPAAEARA